MIAVAERARSAPLLIDGDDWERYAAGGTWHELFDPGDAANAAPLLAWVLALVVLGLVAFPYVWWVARGLPDAGYAVARPVGLLLLAWPVWWLASLELVEPGRTALVAVLGVLALGAVAIARRHRHALRRWLRARCVVVVTAELVFWTVFAVTLAVRWANPDLWHPSLGGEKPMDFAFLNSVLKAPEFPPADPWFAGGYVNYYYFGFVLVGALVELTGVVPYVAYNLAIPTLAASLAAAAFGATVALAARGRRPRRGAITSGVLGAAFVAVVGNLGEAEVVWRSLRGDVRLDWWYWNASRAIGAPAGEPAPITEFPAFTYLYADLHAHAIALPFTVVVLVLSLAVVGRRRPHAAARAGLLALLALTLGALWTTNTWDFPTYAVVVLVVLLAAHRSEGATRRGALRAAVTWVAVVAASWLLFAPFHRAYESAFAGVTRWRGARTGVLDYLTVHGLFLFVLVSALVLEAAYERRVGATGRLLRLLLRRPRSVGRTLSFRRALAPRADTSLLAVTAVAAAVALAGALALARAGVAAIVLLVAVLVLVVWTRRPRSPTSRAPDLWRRLTLALALLGLALTLAVELFVVDRIDIGRTNTVFKTYLQVWVLWAVAAAASLPVAYEHLRRTRLPTRLAWRSAFVVLLAVAMLYPALATPAKIRDRFDRSAGPTLDGMAFMERAVYADNGVEMPLADDLAGIRWMLAEVPGSPVVAELNTWPKLYGWGNRFAMFTGNPAVVGWDYHERQQRGAVADAEIRERIRDVQRLYATDDADEASRLLARYGVRYVVVGRLERAYFPGGQAKWTRAAGRLWRPVFRHGELAIYRVGVERAFSGTSTLRSAQ